MNALTEMTMRLYPREWKRLVGGEGCRLVDREAIKGLLGRTMNLALLARGLTDKEIAAEVSGSPFTVSNHLRNICAKICRNNPGPR
jgi:DNA-binding NarL/FixJ family response regulator